MNMCAFTYDDIDRGTSIITQDKQRWGGNRRFVRNQHKNTVSYFLMQTYGIDYMNKDEGVINVGGGKGELDLN